MRDVVTRAEMKARRVAMEAQFATKLQTRGVEALLREMDSYSAALSPENFKDLTSWADKARTILLDPDALPEKEANEILAAFKRTCRVYKELHDGRGQRPPEALKTEVRAEQVAIDEWNEAQVRGDASDG